MKKINLYLLFVIFICFSTAAVAGQSVLWPDNTGFDPTTSENWKIDAGTLVGWQDSNFEILEYQASGKSEEVGTGITVNGIKVDWKYPRTNSIGKGEEIGLNQSIDYTVVAFFEIPSTLKMNVFGNGGRNGSHDDFDLLNGENDISGEDNHLMLFSPSMGGIVDADWSLTNINAVDYATGLGAESYINACDLWTAEIWANVPYGFTVSSTGLGGDYLDNPLLIEMRYLKRVNAGIVSQEFGLPLYGGDEVANSSDWYGDYVLDEEGVEVGTYEAGQNVYINMQFRIPITGAPAGRYQGEVTFSSYTI